MLRILSVIALACSASPVQAQVRDTAAMRAEVQTINRTMEAEFARGDMKAFGAHFADNAIIRSSRAIGASGRAGIDGYFSAVPNPKAFVFESYGISVQGDVAYQTGKSTVTFGSAERSNTFQFMMVWQRQGGALKALLYYYHVVEPTGGGPG